jgi:sulfate permease, SulP family
VSWLVLDASAITSVDFSAARVLRDLVRRGATLVFVNMELSRCSDLQRHRLSHLIGPNRTFDTLHEARAAITESAFRPCPFPIGKRSA